MKGKDIIVVSSLGAQAYYPIGQNLSINGRTCVVAKSGDCVNCAVCVPNVPLHDQEVTCTNLACTADEREDKTSVHFKVV
jgi:hypothetical protein